MFQELLYGCQVSLHFGEILESHVSSYCTTNNIFISLHPIYLHQLIQNLFILQSILCCLFLIPFLLMLLREHRWHWLLILLPSPLALPPPHLTILLQLIIHLIILLGQILILPPQLLHIPSQLLYHDILPLQILAQLVDIHLPLDLIQIPLDELGGLHHVAVEGFVLFLFGDQLSLQGEVDADVVGVLLLEVGYFEVFLLDLELVVLDELHCLVVLGGVGFSALEPFEVLDYLLSVLVIDILLRVQSLDQLCHFQLLLLQRTSKVLYLLLQLFVGLIELCRVVFSLLLGLFGLQISHLRRVLRLLQFNVQLFVLSLQSLHLRQEPLEHVVVRFQGLHVQIHLNNYNSGSLQYTMTVIQNYTISIDQIHNQSSARSSFTFPPCTLVTDASDASVTPSALGISILSPGLKAGNPLQGHVAHLKASPRQQLPQFDFTVPYWICFTVSYFDCCCYCSFLPHLQLAQALGFTAQSSGLDFLTITSSFNKSASSIFSFSEGVTPAWNPMWSGAWLSTTFSPSRFGLEKVMVCWVSAGSAFNPNPTITPVTLA